MSIVRPIVRNTYRDVYRSIVERYGEFDADAAAYITSVIAAGGSPTVNQQDAINDFFSEGWTRDYGLKIMYLPIWGVANANLIELVSKASLGSWGGTPTHSAGYVKGNGTDAYLETTKAPSTLGIGYTSCMVGCLVAAVPTQVGRWYGSQTGSDPLEFYQSSSGAVSSYSYDYTYGAVITASAYSAARGVWLHSRTNTTTHKQFKRTASGVTSSAGPTDAIGSASISATQRGMARNNGGAAAADFSDAGFGAFFSGIGMSDTVARRFLQAVKDLWEKTTGLSLP